MSDHSEETYGTVGSAPDIDEITGRDELAARSQESPAQRLHRIAREMRERAEADMVLRDREKSIAQTATRIVHRVYAADLTMDEFLQERIREWYRGVELHNFPILDFLGMTADEYADWILNDKISDRTERLQLRSYTYRVLRGYP